ncbi:MAG: amino acid ABC transporter ATP-binding protein [Clostridiaceae bacterium]|nr:amino acid ABC transporter ATP-binding protein [Clostridiaceae bacterium]
MQIISVKNIYKSFGGPEALKGISFEVEQGEVLAVIGPSGSGKSTLLRCIAQLETVDSGEISICGEKLVESGQNGETRYASRASCARIGRHIGLVFQSFNLFPHLSALQNIAEAMMCVLGYSRQEAESEARVLLKKMNLENREDAYPCELSGGQQQRVSIARALAMKPDILFFDEPTSALDPELTGEILKVIRQLAEEHMSMVVVTHEMQFARDVADHVIFMDGGSIIEQGSTKELFEDPKIDRTRMFLSFSAK